MYTVEGNKLIAVFMGGILNEDRAPIVYMSEETYYFDELKYHTSWDWLMPVVQKIYGMPRNYQRSTIEFSFYQDGFTIETIWFEVVRYIEVMNSDKNAEVSDTTGSEESSQR